jgi:DNA-binding transcriptional LysR family regulator
MELRHLRYFCAAADEAHIHRAAERLSIAQPALTHQIKALEAELGVKLFARAGRGVVVTEAGRIFRSEARAILDHVDRATALMRQVDAGLVGRLRVGFTESASFSPVLMDLLKGFRTAWPQVECVLEESHTEGLIEALEQGRLDVVFVRPPLRTTRAFVFEALASEPMMVAVPVGHSLAEAPSLSIADLEAQEFVVYPRRHGFGLSDAVIAECRRAGFAPRIAQQTPQLSATINLVAAGMGIAVVPQCMRHQRPDSVRFIPLTGTDLSAELGLATRRDNPSPALAHLVAAALAARSGPPAAA